MNILVNGCSFSRGPNSWPYYLNCTSIVNLACSGAGNTYISDTTIRELTKRTYDHVIIMWSGLWRYDLQSTFNKTSYCSEYQSLQNDWPEKIIYPINDQDYVEKDWIFSCGHVNKEGSLTQSGIFTGIYKYSTDEHLYNISYMKMLALQSYCQANKIKYTFSFYKPYPVDWNIIDKKQCVTEHNIYKIAQRLDDWGDGGHPGSQAHKKWAQIINENRLDI